MKEACRKNDRPLEYLFYKHIGTRLSSHDLFNLELSHHQLFAILIISIFCFDNFTAAKVVHFAGTGKFLLTFFLKKITI